MLEAATMSLSFFLGGTLLLEVGKLLKYAETNEYTQVAFRRVFTTARERGSDGGEDALRYESTVF